VVQSITTEELRRALLAAVTAIEHEEGHLTALDSAIGDGDHGVTMRLGFQAIQKGLESAPGSATPGQILSQAGRDFMRSTGGAIGVILGRALIGAGEALKDRKELNPSDWELCFKSMEITVRSTGKAEPGDKTLLDPLHAINECLANVGKSQDSAEILSRAAKAAEEGASATASMHCRKGRASRLGDRVLGHPDPGAVSFSIIVRALADAMKQMSRASGSSVYGVGLGHKGD